jgi:hypothetical protein
MRELSFLGQHSWMDSVQGTFQASVGQLVLLQPMAIDVQDQMCPGRALEGHSILIF